MLDCNDYGTINFEVREYRKNFLKRKNINGYKKTHKHSPKLIDKMLNALDRRINGLPLFTDEVKQKYFKGLNAIYIKHYTESFNPQTSRKDCYINYLADYYCKFGNHSTLTFKEFKQRGMIKTHRIKL